jgi:hypothetical protein
VAVGIVRLRTKGHGICLFVTFLHRARVVASRLTRVAMWGHDFLCFLSVLWRTHKLCQELSVVSSRMFLVSSLKIPVASVRFGTALSLSVLHLGLLRIYLDFWSELSSVGYTTRNFIFILFTYCHVYRMGSMTNNTTRVRIGYRIYLLWRFRATTQITIMGNTLAFLASWIPLSELHCTDVSLRGLTDKD